MRAGLTQVVVVESALDVEILPGQYFDQETGTHYNYFRDYDPSLGRYIESDPVGLAGGLNTYAYVSGAPLMDIDPQGLTAAAGALGWSGAGGAGTGALGGAGVGAAGAAIGVAGAFGLGYGIGTALYPGFEPGLSKGIDWVCSMSDELKKCIRRCTVAYDETVASVCSKMLTPKGQARCRYSALVVKTTCIIGCYGL